MEDRSETLDIYVALGPDTDAEDVAVATLQLRRELLALDLEAVEVPHGDASRPGTRAVDTAALGAQVVSIGQSQLLTTVVAVVRSRLACSQYWTQSLVDLYAAEPSTVRESVDRAAKPLRRQSER